MTSKPLWINHLQTKMLQLNIILNYTNYILTYITLHLFMYCIAMKFNNTIQHFINSKTYLIIFVVGTITIIYGPVKNKVCTIYLSIINLNIVNVD